MDARCALTKWMLDGLRQRRAERGKKTLLRGPASDRLDVR
jgi:hypothetical protein